METVAALVPPLVMAVAFVAVARAALRYTNGGRPSRPSADDVGDAATDDGQD